MAWFRATYGDGQDARAEFMRDSGRHGYKPYTKGRVAQLFDADQAFGERAAKAVALRLGLGEEMFTSDAQAGRPTPQMPAATTDGGLLMDVLLVLMPDEIAAIRRRAEHVRRQQQVVTGGLSSAPGRESAFQLAGKLSDRQDQGEKNETDGKIRTDDKP